LSVTPSLAPINEWELIFRLGLAVICGAIIGLEREIKDKPAGLRTNVLVSFGTALFVLVQDGRNNASVNNRQNPYQILLLPFAFCLLTSAKRH
jgi:uncharacterized membrane protein YhiD involved in acid resistance